MQGTVKLGPDPRTSCVSPNHRVWNPKTGEEIVNLYVADGSVFPTSVGANPMQSIYTFSKLLAERMLAE